MNHLITIITPTYNRAHTLPRAYKSLKNQTYTNFKWLIMDDGSTDNTKVVIDDFIKENKFSIEYHYHPNKKKFITVFKGIEKIQTKYFVILDSDDSLPNNALEILYNEVEKIKNQENFIGVIGHSIDVSGNIVGDKFHKNVWEGSILEMRYKYKIRGDKNGIFITKSYQNGLQQFDYTPFDKNCYIPQSVFFTLYDAKGLKTKFINENIRIYHLNLEDKISVTNTRGKGENMFGLKEGYLAFINNYNTQLLQYPITLIKNLMGYLIYSLKLKIYPFEIIRKINNFYYKILAIFLLPFSYFVSFFK